MYISYIRICTRTYARTVYCLLVTGYWLLVTDDSHALVRSRSITRYLVHRLPGTRPVCGIVGWSGEHAYLSVVGSKYTKYRFD
jgi:hypothetical protein